MFQQVVTIANFKQWFSKQTDNPWSAATAAPSICPRRPRVGILALQKIVTNAKFENVGFATNEYALGRFCSRFAHASQVGSLAGHGARLRESLQATSSLHRQLAHTAAVAAHVIGNTTACAVPVAGGVENSESSSQDRRPRTHNQTDECERGAAAPKSPAKHNDNTQKPSKRDPKSRAS